MKAWKSLGLGLAVVGLLSLASCSQAGQVSGVYMQSSKDEVVLVQLIETADGVLSGRIEAVNLRADGSIDDAAYSLDGSADHGQIILKSNLFFGVGPVLSGDVRGSTLHIISNTGTGTFTRTNLKAFQAEKQKLATRGMSVKQANAQTKARQDEAAFLQDLSSQGVNLVTSLRKLPEVETKADAYTTRTSQSRDRIFDTIADLKQKARTASPDQRSDIGYAIQDQMYELNSLKSDYESVLHELAFAYNDIETAIGSFKAHCNEAGAKGYQPLPAQCSDIPSYGDQYQASRSRMRTQANAILVTLKPPQ